jgi:hypothetical protein
LKKKVNLKIIKNNKKQINQITAKQEQKKGQKTAAAGGTKRNIIKIIKNNKNRKTTETLTKHNKKTPQNQ